jgi:Circadian oscillating protein COP23
MNFSIINLQKTPLISSLWTVLILLNVSPATARNRFSLIFECRLNPKTKISSTYIVYSDDVTSELIRWKSKAIRNPNVTCRNASNRFQELWSSGQLNYLKINKRLVCGIPTLRTPCDESTKLFELLPNSNPKTVASTLLHKISVRDSNKEPIFETSDDEIIINFREAIKQLHYIAVPSRMK